jgi:predicted ATPase
MALGGTLMAARGYAHAETEAAYERARALCEAAGDSATLAWVLLMLANIYTNRGEPDRSVMHTERLLAVSDETRDRSLVLHGHNIAALAKHYQGCFAASLAHAERVITLYDPARDRWRAFHHGNPNDPCVGALGFAAWNLWYLGHADRSLGRAREGVTLARTLDEPFNLAFALFLETQVHQWRRDWRAQRERATEVIAVADVQGYPLLRGAGRMYHGLARVNAGEGADALTEVAEGLALTAETGTMGGTPGGLLAVADGQRAAGQPAEALGTVERGLAVATETGQHLLDAGLYHLKGELLLVTDPASSAEAEALFCRALDIARAQEAKSFELRAATSLAQLWQRQGKRAEARALLGPVYAWFTEGFDTGDLVEAKALLDELT